MSSIEDLLRTEEQATEHLAKSLVSKDKIPYLTEIKRPEYMALLEYLAKLNVLGWREHLTPIIHFYKLNMISHERKRVHEVVSVLKREIEEQEGTKEKLRKALTL